jgi:rhomboid family GlyGly-CTERM serine protease
MIATSSRPTADPSPTLRARLLRDAVPIALLVGCVAAELFGDAGRGWLRYERAAVLAGEAWRLLSGSVVHLGPRHLVLNLAALVALWALAPAAVRGRRGALAIAGGALGVGAGLLVFAPAVGWYVGVSGVLHGLLAVAARDLVRARDALGIPLALLLLAKLIWESGAGPLPFTAQAAGGPVIVVAHLYGTLGALLAVVVAEALARRRL